MDLYSRRLLMFDRGMKFCGGTFLTENVMLLFVVWLHEIRMFSDV